MSIDGYTSMIDTHAHLYLCEDPIPDLLSRATDAGVQHIVHIGLDMQRNHEVIQLATQYPQTVPVVGIHPLSSHDFDSLAEFEQLLQTHPEIRAVGEIGCDYKLASNYEQQQAVCTALYALARQYKKPVVIHNRHADDDVAAIMNAFPDVPTVLHCYASSPEFLDTVMRDNLMVSFTGMITYSQKGKVIRSLQSLPLSQLMIETDCPYLTPKPYAGQRNEPAFVHAIADKIAAVHHVPLTVVLDTTTQNARSFFSIPC